MTMLDIQLVRSLTELVADVLADQRLRNDGDDRQPSPEQEIELARSTVRAEVARLAVKRPLDAWPPLDEEGIVNEVIAQVLGLGGLESLLSDPDVSDIHVRGCDSVWVKLRDGRRERRAPIVESDEELVSLIRRAGTRFSRTEKRFDAGTPELNMQLPDGSRLFAVMEVSTRPSLIIRRHRFELSSLDELRGLDVFDHDVQSLLAAMVRSRRNVVIAGGTGSGKTTLLRALINEVPPTERIVTIEDAYELGLEHFAERHPDYDALQSRSANIEGQGEVTLADLTRMALRMDPDRVIVGEVRGAEAFPMLMAMSQGNNGSMCTMHADGTRSVFPKIAAYVSMASTGLPIETVNVLVASALHFVIFIENRDGRRRIASICEVVDTDGSN
ncbi:MAG: CpaF family protein, partial [Actinobacteria bacterium]|nr:CpaF family protein [Actinomycetota bacterium]